MERDKMVCLRQRVLQGLRFIPLIIIFPSVIGIKATENTTTFDFFPDRDSSDFFSIRVPIAVVSSTEVDSINVMIINDHGYVCAEKTSIRDLEIRRLQCDQCMQGKLHVTIELKNQTQILSRTQAIVSDESRRTEICNIKPEHRREGENIRITVIKRIQEGGCRWFFRDESGHIGCCYSNRDYYNQSGGCDPYMQSFLCREGYEIPIIKEEENTCTLQISNLSIKDSGNYLTNYDRGIPTFKTYLVVANTEQAFGSGSYVGGGFKIMLFYNILMMQACTLKVIK